MADLHKLTIKEALEFSAKNDPSLIAQELSERINIINPKINCFLRTNENPLKKEDLKGNALYGVPISVKDNICLKGKEVSCASKILKGHVAPYDATVISKLKNSGAYIFGQCNMDEFAFGSSCETSAFGPTKNPWDFSCVPGGSSGGSAAAVASDMTIAALGSDTGGSIRQPASFCGIVGVKPTYGRVSRYGLIAFGSSFDQIGPITKTVYDAALLMNVISGHDPKDSTSFNREVPDFTKALTHDVKGLKIGLPEEFFNCDIDSEVASAAQNAAKTLERLGAKLVKISLPHVEYSVAVYYIVAVAEASSNLGRFDGVQYGSRIQTEDLRDMYFETRSQGFGEEAKRRILLGTFVLSAGYYDAFYLKGQKVRTLVRNDFEDAFKEVDLILSPTSPTTAFKIGEKAKDPVSMYLSDIFTIPANLSGIPAMSVPCGFSKNGLPIGLQFMAKAFDEETMLKVAHAFEQETEYYKKKPEM